MSDSPLIPGGDSLEPFLASALNTEVFGGRSGDDLLPRLEFVAEMLASAAIPIPQPALLFRAGDSAVRVVPIQGCLRFGRAVECEISMPGYREISRTHFSIQEEDDRYYLTDSGSYNGTFVRGNPVRVEKRELLTGDIIDVCNFTFVFIRE